MVVIACSSAEYEETLNKFTGDDVYVKENAELLPLHPYAISKVGQDLLAFQYFMNDHIRSILSNRLCGNNRANERDPFSCR